MSNYGKGNVNYGNLPVNVGSNIQARY